MRPHHRDRSAKAFSCAVASGEAFPAPPPHLICHQTSTPASAVPKPMPTEDCRPATQAEGDQGAKVLRSRPRPPSLPPATGAALSSCSLLPATELRSTHALQAETECRGNDNHPDEKQGTMKRAAQLQVPIFCDCRRWVKAQKGPSEAHHPVRRDAMRGARKGGPPSRPITDGKAAPCFFPPFGGGFVFSAARHPSRTAKVAEYRHKPGYMLVLVSRQAGRESIIFDRHWLTTAARRRIT